MSDFDIPEDEQTFGVNVLVMLIKKCELWRAEALAARVILGDDAQMNGLNSWLSWHHDSSMYIEARKATDTAIEDK